MDAQADIAAQDIEGCTALHHAAAAGHQSAAFTLLQRIPIDVLDIKDKTGYTAKDLAAAGKHTAIMKEISV